tara:strand:+ start:71 stop:616 length:546 start_codon:yes stop_codon:yes gene_type:complete
MASILNVDKIRATGSTNDALQVQSNGFVIPKAGGIIQMQKSASRSSANNTTSSTYAEIHTDYRLAFTPVTANSYLQLNFYFHGVVGGNTRMGVKFYVSTNSDYSSATAVSSATFDEVIRTANHGSSSASMGRFVLSELYTAHTDTSTLYFTPYFNRLLGSNTARVNDNGGFSYVTIMEIAE